MENTKSLILLVTLTTATLMSSTSLAISPHIGKNLFKYGALPLAVWTTLNGLAAPAPIAHIKKNGFLTAGVSFLGLPFMYVGGSLFKAICGEGLEKKLPDFHIKNSFTIGGLLAVGASIAGIRYFNKQIEAQKKQQSNNNNVQIDNPPTPSAQQ